MNRYKIPVIVLVVMCFGVMGVIPADGSTVKKRNIADLISLGDQIITGKVVSVSDGFGVKNVPYTEVTVSVEETHKGNASGNYTFRQYGLTEPRQMANGRVYLGVTPDGWPTYAEGEKVILFLYKPAKLTGLRTTVGLFQGKFTVEEGRVFNIVSNEGLFKDVQVDKSKLSEREVKMLETKKGKIPEEVFTSFLRKATREGWFDRYIEREGE